MRGVFALVCLLLGLSGIALAQDAAKDADAAREAGLAHFYEGRYAEAAAEFRRAYDLSKAPELLYNLAESYRLAGDCKSALEFYDKAEAVAPEGAARDEIGRRREEMAQCVARAKVTTTPTPPKEGPPAPPVGEPHGRPGRTLKLTGLAVSTAGVLLIGAGLYFGFQARDAADEVSDYFAAGGLPWDDEIAATEDRGKRDNQLAIAFTITGATALVTGGVLYYLGHRETERAAVGVAPTAHGGAVTWSLRF